MKTFRMTVGTTFEVPIETAMFILSGNDPATSANDWISTQTPLRIVPDDRKWENPHVADIMRRELGLEMVRQAIAEKQEQEQQATVNG